MSEFYQGTESLNFFFQRDLPVTFRMTRGICLTRPLCFCELDADEDVGVSAGGINRVLSTTIDFIFGAEAAANFFCCNVDNPNAFLL